jgi:transposase
MSLQPQDVPPVPDETRRVARAAFPKGHVYIPMRDALGAIYQDHLFAPLFPTQGQPAASPWRLALTTIIQFAEGLSDRQAADAVRSRIDWKYALSLELTNPGFDFSVLSEFRARLIAGSLEQQLLEAMLTHCKVRGLLKARGQQRTDSTHVLAAIRTLNRLESVGETLRAALNSLAVVAPDWLLTQVTSDWFDRYGTRVEEYRLPKGKAAREVYAAQIGADGFRLLDALDADDTRRWLREVPAVQTLRRMWAHQYTRGEGRIRLRTARELPPAGDRFDSPYDPEAHYGNKRTTTWTGYKVHLTETCAPHAPHLITRVETTSASMTDVTLTAPIHEALAAKALLPSTHLVDAGYVDATLLVSSPQEHQVDLVGPVRTDVSRQARAGQGYDISAFTVDWEAQTVTCPAGHTSVTWHPRYDRWGNAVIHVDFHQRHCHPCPHRPLCTRAKREPRELTLKPRAEHEALLAARERQTTAAWQAQYAVRAGIEGTLSQGIRALGLRRARYIGLAKTHLQHLATAAAMNLVRVDAWLSGVPLARTRTSRFAALRPGAA